MKNGQKHHKNFSTWRFFIHKINKNMQRKPVKKCVVYSRVWCHFQKKLCSIITSWKTGQNITNICTRLFLHKTNKNMSLKQRWSFSLRSPLRKLFILNISYYDWERHFMQKKFFITVSLVQYPLESSTYPNKLYKQICNTWYYAWM